jgi:hypothetical protein
MEKFANKNLIFRMQKDINSVFYHIPFELQPDIYKGGRQFSILKLLRWMVYIE